MIQNYLKKYRQKNNQLKKGIAISEATITEVAVQSDIVLLDLASGIERCTNLLSVLREINLDVINDSFINYSQTGYPPFSAIKKDFDNIYSNDYSVKNKAADIVEKFFFTLLPLLGQLLTDFDNGFVFRKMLLEKGYEGYVFNEEPTSPTYCLFFPEKLSRPYHQIIQ